MKKALENDCKELHFSFSMFAKQSSKATKIRFSKMLFEWGDDGRRDECKYDEYGPERFLEERRLTHMVSFCFCCSSKPATFFSTLPNPHRFSAVLGNCLSSNFSFQYSVASSSFF